MTSTLSPHDTGDIRLGEGTRDLTYLTRSPVLRRPETTGEMPVYEPATIGIVSPFRMADAPTEVLLRGSAELARLALGETMVLPVGAEPAPPRHAAPAVYEAAPEVPEAVKPPGYRGVRRKADPPWAWALIGAGTVLAAQAAAFVGTVLLSAVIW